MGDGICDQELYDFGIDCCWDGGDCHACDLEMMLLNPEGSHKQVICADSFPPHLSNGFDPTISHHLASYETNFQL